MRFQRPFLSALGFVLVLALAQANATAQFRPSRPTITPPRPSRPKYTPPRPSRPKYTPPRPRIPNLPPAPGTPFPTKPGATKIFVINETNGTLDLTVIYRNKEFRNQTRYYRNVHPDRRIFVDTVSSPYVTVTGKPSKKEYRLVGNSTQKFNMFDGGRYVKFRGSLIRPLPTTRQETTRRNQFVTQSGSTFSRSGSRQWVETRRGGPSSRFSEISSNSRTVELYDSSRKMYVRLSSHRAQWRSGANATWRTWPGSTGSWR